jgi:hypothetical protein
MYVYSVCMYVQKCIMYVCIQCMYVRMQQDRHGSMHNIQLCRDVFKRGKEVNGRRINRGCWKVQTCGAVWLPVSADGEGTCQIEGKCTLCGTDGEVLLRISELPYRR